MSAVWGRCARRISGGGECSCSWWRCCTVDGHSAGIAAKRLCDDGGGGAAAILIVIHCCCCCCRRRSSKPDSTARRFEWTGNLSERTRNRNNAPNTQLQWRRVYCYRFRWGGRLANDTDVHKSKQSNFDCQCESRQDGSAGCCNNCICREAPPPLPASRSAFRGRGVDGVLAFGAGSMRVPSRTQYSTYTMIIRDPRTIF